MARIGLSILAGMQTVLGFWTLLFPRSFYDNVPTVDLTPPFSEHLFRDFGAASLGIAFMLAVAAARLERRLVRPAVGAYLIFAVPHLVFHVTHLGDFSVAQVVMLSAGLVAAILVAAWTFVTAGRLKCDPPAQT